MSDSAFLFLISNGRSGSTLVHEVLSRHPDVGFLSNLEDRLALPPAAGRLNNALYRRIPPALTRKGRLRYAPSEGYRALTREVSPMLARSSRDLLESDAMPWVAERFRHFFAERAPRASRSSRTSSPAGRGPASSGRSSRRRGSSTSSATAARWSPPTCSRPGGRGTSGPSTCTPAR